MAEGLYSLDRVENFEVEGVESDAKPRSKIDFRVRTFQDDIYNTLFWMLQRHLILIILILAWSKGKEPRIYRRAMVEIHLSSRQGRKGS